MLKHLIILSFLAATPTTVWACEEGSHLSDSQIRHNRERIRELESKLRGNYSDTSKAKWEEELAYLRGQTPPQD